ncbi:helix-turn-helix transcriptional regulator [Streptomyces sp. NPDC042319]|uniref:helix-turn-helix domain-containing protein n=1 Tax=Streptomyces sp. NPDC042319 TaxID=3154332 RepID=UPI0033F4B845
MTAALHDLLGIDPDDPEVAAAAADAEAYAEIVESLVVLRRRRGLTQTQVAERMQTTQSAVSDFERVGGDARYSTLQRYARAVGARLDSMVNHLPADLALTWRPATEVPVRLAPMAVDHEGVQAPWTEAAQGTVTSL